MYLVHFFLAGKNPMADFTHWYGFDHYVFAYHRPTPLPK